MIWRAAAGLARLLPPEAAHRAAVETLRRRIGPSPELDDMPVDVAGLSFRNPVGLVLSCPSKSTFERLKKRQGERDVDQDARRHL